MVSASAARALAVRCTPVDVAILQGEADRATGDSFLADVHRSSPLECSAVRPAPSISGTGAPWSRSSAEAHTPAKSGMAQPVEEDRGPAKSSARGRQDRKSTRL